MPPGSLCPCAVQQLHALSAADALLSRLLHFLRSPLLQVQNLRTLRELFRTFMQLQYPAGGNGPAASFSSLLTFAFLSDAIAKSMQAHRGANNNQPSSSRHCCSSCRGAGGSGQYAAYIRRLLVQPSLRKLITLIATGEHSVSRMAGDAADASNAAAALACEGKQPHLPPLPSTRFSCCC